MLTVLETASQVRWYAENRSQPLAENILAVTPDAAYACQQLSLPYLKMEERCQYARRFAEYPSILEIYLNWEAWLDDWSRQAIPEFAREGFKPASAVTFLLQLLFAELWATATNLREFVESTNPDRVEFWSPLIDEVPAFLQPPISPATALMPDLELIAGIEKIDLAAELPELRPTTRADRANLPPLSQIKNWAKKSLRQSSIFTELEAVQRHGPAIVSNRLGKTPPRILVSGFGYDLEPVILELLGRGAAITRLKDNSASVCANGNQSSSALGQKLSEAWDALTQQPDLWRPLNRWRIGRTDLLLKPLHFWWHNLVPVLWNRYQQTSRLLKRKQYSGLLTMDCGGSTWGGPDCQAALAARVPRWAVQHGGSTGCDAKIWQMFLRGSDTFLVAGEGTARELDQNRPPILGAYGNFRVVGSSRLDKLRRQNSPKKVRELRRALQAGDPRPMVLYIPNSFGTYGRAISDLAAFPEVSYMELQQNALRQCTEFPGVRLLYKELIVANDPNRVTSDYVQKNIPNGTVTNQRLTDIMWAVDAIIVDHPITALSEVLLTNKRLIVYMPAPNASAPDARSLLEKRARVCETPSEFIESIREFLKAGDFSEIENPDTQFLRQYCTHSNDGLSAVRAADAILGEVSMVDRQPAHEI